MIATYATTRNAERYAAEIMHKFPSVRATAIPATGFAGFNVRVITGSSGAIALADKRPRNYGDGDNGRFRTKSRQLEHNTCVAGTQCGATFMTTALDRRTCALLAPQVDYILLDGSHSMRSQWWQACASIDAYVEVLKHENINSQVVLATFDSSDIACVQRDCRLADFVPLAREPIGAHWTRTPLYDAINVMGRNLREMRPERAHIVIVTDGDENASITTLAQARAVLDWCRAHGWQVTFLGAGFDNAQQAALLGTNAASAIGVAQARLTDAAKGLAHKRVRYARTGEDIHWDESERQQFGGYLASASASAP